MHLKRFIPYERKECVQGFSCDIIRDKRLTFNLQLTDCRQCTQNIYVTKAEQFKRKLYEHWIFTRVIVKIEFCSIDRKNRNFKNKYLPKASRLSNVDLVSRFKWIPVHIFHNISSYLTSYCIFIAAHYQG